MFPKASDKTAFWANIRDGVDAISAPPATHWRPDDYRDADPNATENDHDRDHCHHGV